MATGAGLRAEWRVRQVFFADVPSYRRTPLDLDAAVDIDAVLEGKVVLALNAVDLAHMPGAPVSSALDLCRRPGRWRCSGCSAAVLLRESGARTASAADCVSESPSIMGPIQRWL